MLDAEQCYGAKDLASSFSRAPTTLLTVFLAFSSSERTGDGLEGAVVAGAGDAQEDGQHDEAVVGGEENDEEENLESHANVINDSQVH